ncbi:MAG: M16 family metallopeptidase, partial [Candidatus Puniceispirillaceae bacterium]
MDIRTQTLANGLEVATISMPFAHSISLGIWVKAGARDELEGETGIAHFLEHMAFKGTSDRTAAQIASDIENVGGFMNAYTSREETAYFIRLLPDEVALGVNLLCDILTDSQLPAHEIERERGV